MIKERLSLFALIAFVFLIGVVFILAAAWVAKTNEFWGDFVRDLGIAVVISSVVAFAFERYLRERLYQQVEDRIASILDRFRMQAVDSFELQKLPLQILDVVRKEILAANVIDRNLQAYYQIEEIPINDQPVLRATVTTSYTLENLTGNWEKVQLHETGIYQYGPSEWIEIPSDVGFSEFSIEHESGEHEPPFQLSRPAIRSLILRRGQREVLTRLIELGPQAKVIVKTVEIGYFKRDDYDSFEAECLTIGMKVSLSILASGYVVSAEPDDILINFLRTTEDESNGFYIWESDRALLPGQGIHIEWEPRD